MATRILALMTGTLAAVLVLTMALPAHARPESKVFLNGVPTKVYFMDGDSFRVLEGRFAGNGARLAGFNTLESYGNVHQWGAKSFRELWVNAKKATLNARRGLCWDEGRMRYRRNCTKAWHCTSDLKRDGYGRMLWWCPDLAYDQVRKGLAHAMSVRGPAKPKLIEAQRLAIAEKVGMWSRGIPEFVLTSLHSFDEPYAKEKGSAYNRLVSIVDGHSQKWLHRRVYPECTVVCRQEVTEPEKILTAAEALKKDDNLAGFVAEYDAEALVKIVRRFAEVGEVYWTSDKHAPEFEKVLAPMRVDGRLGKLRRGSCMTYADYRRRFGANAAPCLH